MTELPGSTADEPAADAPPAPPATAPVIAEPALDDGEIQGNVVPGFMKPHMRLVALRIDDAAAARRWLRSAVPRVTTFREAMGTRVQVREHRRRHPLTGDDRNAIIADDRDPLANPRPDGINDAWFNLAISHEGLSSIFAGDSTRLAELDAFEDPAFRLGLTQRSQLLGDPLDPGAEGHPSRWKVGSPGREPHLLLIFAADLAADLVELHQEVMASAQGMTAVYEEDGAKLTARGSEHFGFKDGISQPGIRGRWGDAGEYVTPRTVDPSRQPEASLYGLPGQHLVWPGEFVFGYPGQAADPLEPGLARQPGPAWS
ncbi:MAG: hypothetical protein ABR564_07755, partial [Candidatus Dormibacteria bacterium]